MRTSRGRIVGLVLVGVLAAGCASSPGSMNGSMMDRGRGAGGPMGQAVPRGSMMPRPTCSAPSSLPGARVTVVLGDMGLGSRRMMGGVSPMGSRMMLHAVPATVPAGMVSFVAENLGRRTHELVVLPLAKDQAAGQRVPGADGKVDEEGSLGEASATCRGGAGEGIRSGAVGWVTLTLAPGRYELICNLRNHYAHGMHQLLVVA